MYARYTVVLKDLLETEQTKQLIEKALDSYPMYKAKSNQEFIPNIIPSREELNKKLLNNYKYREIGFETVGRFIDELEIAMNEIMPYYNQLMFTQDQDYNIIFNVDYVREGLTNIEAETSQTGSIESTDGETTTGTSTTTATDKTSTNADVKSYSKDVNLDTPQKSVTLPSAVEGIGDAAKAGADKLNYASEAKWSSNISHDEGESSGESESTSTSGGTAQRTSSGSNEMSGRRGEQHTSKETIKGNFGVVSAQDLVAKYREIILNIEQMIINDNRIKELFMQVY